MMHRLFIFIFITLSCTLQMSAQNELAVLKELGKKAAVSEDSLNAALQDVRRLEERLRHTDRVKAAMLETFLSYLPQDSIDYRALALSDLDALAKARVTDYPDMTRRLPMGRYFNDDILSAMGYELKAFREMHDYYGRQGNRPATMLTALEMLREERNNDRSSGVKTLPRYINRLDSLMGLYGDLDVSAEIAIEKYQQIGNSDVLSNREKIDELSRYIARYQKYERVNVLRNIFNDLTRPEYDARLLQSELTTADSVRIRVHQHNTQGMTLRISGTKHKIDKTFDEYSSTNDTITLPPLSIGDHTLTINFKSKSKFKKEDKFKTILHVSDIRPILMPIPDNGGLLTVVDGISGEPLPQAKVRINNHYYPVNAAAEATLPDLDDIDDEDEDDEEGGANLYLMGHHIGKGTFCLREDDNVYVEYEAEANDEYEEYAELMTDRSIYRPGQTVHLALVAYSVKKTENKPLVGRKIAITVENPQYRTIDTLHVTTDEFGSAHCDYRIPQHTPLGTYYFEIDDDENDIEGRTDIRVEEYKRPTFETDIDASKDIVRIGDNLQLKGYAKTLTGDPVRNAKAVINSRLWIGLYNGNGRIIATRRDTVQADDQGRYTVSLPVKSDHPEDNEAKEIRMDVTVTVTDAGGESHDTKRYYSFTQKGFSLSSDFNGQWIEKKEAKGKQIMVSARNFAGKQVKMPIESRLSLLPRDMKDSKGTEVLRLTTDTTFTLPADLQPGRYALTSTCQGESLRKEFVIFDRDATRPCIETDDWYDPDTEPFDLTGGKPLRIRIGSSEQDVHIYYAVYGVDTLLTHGRLDLSDAIVSQEFPYQEAYGDGITVYHAWYKNGKYHHHETKFYKPLPEKRLNAEWTTFRNRLTPGQQEEWRLRLTHPDGTPANAQMMATLYDHSLDQLTGHRWSFRPRKNQPYLYMRDHLIEPKPYYNSGSGLLKKLKEPSLDMSHLVTGWSGGWTNFHGQVLDQDGEPLIGATVYVVGKIRQGTVTDIDGKFSIAASYGDKITASYIGYRSKTVMLTNRLTIIRLEEDYNALNEVVVVGYGVAKNSVYGARSPQMMENRKSIVTGRVAGLEVTMATGSTKFTEPEVKYDQETKESSDPNTVERMAMSVRENLQETAFFYPALRTDADGNVSIAFTLPESLTSWRLLGEAHTRDLDVALVEATATVHKDLMVQPNMPRFIRCGDAAHITARVNNTSGHALTGKATMQLIDPETEQVVYTQTKDFNVATDNSTAVTFDYRPTAATPSLLTCKIMATAGNMSDGEQHYLPVLPDHETLTQTRSFTLNEAGSTTIDAAALFPNGSTDQRLTLEYTNNPAWLMVQALHTYSHPYDECAVCQAIAYFSQTATGAIAAQPQVAAAVRQWSEEGDSITLQSSLMRNEELKNILMEESPLTLAAANETEQKEQLIDLLDDTRLKDKQNRAILALRSLQNSDGSWSWFKGMGGSYLITRVVTEQLVRANVLGGHQKATQPMLDEAFKYLARYGADMHYLYLCMLDGREPSDSLHREVRKELKSLKKQGNLISDIYDAAMRAMVLEKKYNDTARDLLDKILSLTVYDKEKGRYFDSYLAPYSWLDYKIPTHVMVMEALQRIRPDDTKTLDEMRQWLLQEKRTQYWVTAVNSANAIYAFLNGNMEALNPAPMPDIRFNGQPIDTSSATSALGYLKTSPSSSLQWARDVNSTTKPSALNLVIDKSDNHTGWGAVYAQYTQASEDVKASGNGLTMKREIIAPHKGALRVGDKIRVRITLTAERDLDFVQISDKRPACMEPVDALSGYHRGAYVYNRDCSTQYFISMLSKGTHTFEKEFYIDRAGTYQSGTCTAQCAYAPEYAATAPAVTLVVE